MNVEVIDGIPILRMTITELETACQSDIDLELQSLRNSRIFVTDLDIQQKRELINTLDCARMSQQNRNRNLAIKELANHLEIDFVDLYHEVAQ